jgi:hypothetical protein
MFLNLSLEWSGKVLTSVRWYSWFCGFYFIWLVVLNKVAFYPQYCFLYMLTILLFDFKLLGMAVVWVSLDGTFFGVLIYTDDVCYYGLQLAPNFGE